MKKVSTRSLLLFLLYLISAIGLTLLVIRNQSKDPEPKPGEREEEQKQSDKLKPYELFYFDRNYPAPDASPDLFQDMLRESMDYDRSVAKSNRGLDYPWTIEGPGNLGGRVNTLVVHPSDPSIMLIGFSQGGIYRTADGGQNWYPVFDDQPSLAIGHISFDPHSPDIVWATTGDINISGYPFLGTGLYRSIDSGQSWSYAGLDGTGVLSKVLVDPNSPNIIYVGSMGYPSHKGNERGLFRSADGGGTWQKTLTIDDSTGVIDLVTDPTKPGRIFASGWTRIRTNKISTLLGPGSCLYKSEDYGATWSHITSGLPDGIHSRTSIEIANDGTLFISYVGDITEGNCAGNTESLQAIYKSVDGGQSWDTVSTGTANGVVCGLFGGMGWYFEALKVNPDNPLDLFLLGVSLYRTLDGGINWYRVSPPWWTYEVHADNHDLVFAHGNLYLGTDGGAYKAELHETDVWVDIENIPSTQFYRTAFNPHTPDLYYGGAQDNGTSGGNSTFINEWPRIFGGDGFQPCFDPTEPTWMYALTQNGSVHFSEDGGLDFDELNEGLHGARYWDMPLIVNHHDPKVLYCGSYKLFRMDMRDSIRVWKEISPDLTRGDTLLGNRYPAITAIAQSDLDSLRLYAGTQDGLIWTSSDGGINWIDVTVGTPGFFVTSIECSTTNPEGVYATYSGYRDNDHQPYIFRSDDAGVNWEPIASDLPMLGVNSLYLLPDWNDAVIFAATDGGVYVSQDAGAKWERVGSNMPYMPVYDLDYNPVTNMLVAATFSRGIMTFPVEELDFVSEVDTPITNSLSSISVYPTVVEESFTIDFSQYIGTKEKLQIQISNSSGHTVQNIVTHHESFEDQHQISLEGDWSPGLYFVSISTPLEQNIAKIIVTD